jgi:hypothetical protein
MVALGQYGHRLGGLLQPAAGAGLGILAQRRARGGRLVRREVATIGILLARQRS